MIQEAMGWQNHHTHAFTIDGARYGRPHSELGFRDERTATLTALLKPGTHFEYTYDFGDSWEHLITVEQIQTASAGLHYPYCMDGAEVVWLGLRSATEFAPDRFAPDEANARLLRLTAP